MYVHDLDPVAFYLINYPISWYWVFYPISFFLIYFFARKHLNKTLDEFVPKDFIDFVVVLWFSVIVGGRLGYFLFYQPQLLLNEPGAILEIWRGGMSFHGALLLCLFSAWLLQKYRHIPAVTYGSGILLFLPIGLFLGRVGNFINGELWGNPTELPWGMVFPKADGLVRHPSQLYEAILEGPFLFLTLWVSKQKIPTAIGFILFYGIFRFFIEFTREADRHIGYFAGLSLGQYLCLLMIIASVVSLFFHRRTKHL
jgi:phosphatidylglycerol:prolipoprotein diacylglycerol transferase